MIRYSKDVNVYVDCAAPIHEKKIPDPLKAAINYRRRAKDLGRANLREVTTAALENDYENAILLFKDELKLIYQILSPKGGFTKEEWEHIKTSITKSAYMFPDVTMELGTTKAWKIDEKSADAFLRATLSELGFQVRIIPSSGGALLYENENDFLKKLASEFSVNMDLQEKERTIRIAEDYNGTKKRLNYLTIYDFLKFQLGIDNVPTKAGLLEILGPENEKDIGIISWLRTFINESDENLWAEYDKYLEYKMIEVLARWYGKSTARILSGEAYEHFSECVSDPLFSSAIRLLKIHTASLNHRKSSVSTSGSNASFQFQIDRLNGDVYACVNVGSYETSFASAGTKVKLTSPTTLQLDHLDYGKTYCVSLWEVIDDDAVKLGDLPKVTPGIKWPVLKKVTKTPSNDKLHITIQTEGGEGDISYVACYKQGKDVFASPKDGAQAAAAAKVGTFVCSIENLAYDTEYSFCVYVLLDGGKYYEKLIEEFTYTPKEAQLEKVIRKSTSSSNYKFDAEIHLDFISKEWPPQFSAGTVRFACRTDRFPEELGDSSPGFSINSINKTDYINSVFKLRTPDDSIYEVLYICGWLVTETGDTQLVVKNALYDLVYQMKGNVVNFRCPGYHKAVTHMDLPVLRIYCFDRKDNIVYANEKAVVDNDLKFTIEPGIKAKQVLVEAASAGDRLVYVFRNRAGLKIGKSKIPLF